MKPIIFALSTIEDHPGFLRMQRTCREKGWPLDVRVEPWPGESQMWQKFFDMLPKYREQGYTHALRLDAWDIVALGKPDELQGCLDEYGSPTVLVSAEVACWPGDYRRNEYPPPRSPWCYAHSPMTIDLSKEIHPRVFQNSHEGYGADQKHFGDLVLNKVPGVALDDNCRVVQALGHCHPWQKFFDMAGGRMTNLVTGTRPLFVHGNGRTEDQWVAPY